MDVSRAKQILEVLAEGVNPLTGEILPLDDSCNQGDVVRALLFCFLRLCETSFPASDSKRYSCRLLKTGKKKTQI